MAPGPTPRAAQVTGQTVRRRLDRSIAEFARAADERDVVAGGIDAGLEQLVQAASAACFARPGRVRGQW